MGKQRRKGRKLTSIKVLPSATLSVRHFCAPSVPLILLSANSCSPFPTESKGCKETGEHNLLDSLNTSGKSTDSAGLSNSLKERTSRDTLHTAYDNTQRQMENMSALKVRNTKLLSKLERELEQRMSKLAQLPIFKLFMYFSDMPFNTLHAL